MLLAAVSATIGSGWLFGSLFAAQMAGPAAIVSWIIGGMAVIFVALCYAEITTMFPVAGSIGRASAISYGPLLSFLVNFISWLAFAAIVPIEVQAVLQYSTNMFPFLMEKVGNELHLTAQGYLAAGVLTGLLMLVNAVGTRFMSQTNSFFTVWKLLVPAIVIVLFLYKDPHAENLTVHSFAPNGLHGILATLSIGGIVLAFNGFQPAIALAGESENPQKSLPIAIVGSIAICMTVYCLLQLAFVVSVPTESLVQGWQHLNFKGDAGPFAGIAEILGLGWLSFLLYTDAMISPLACGLVFLAAAAQSSYAMSRSGQLPSVFQKRLKNGVPITSLLTSYAFAMSLFFFFHSWQTMSAFYAAAICLCNAVVPVVLIFMRKNFPNLPRPYRIAFYPVTAGIAFFISNLMFYWCGFSVIWKLDLILILGILIAFFLSVFHSKIRLLTKASFKSSLWFLSYLVLMNLVSFFGNFQGNGMIPFGLDFLIIFFISGVCLVSSHRIYK